MEVIGGAGGRHEGQVNSAGGGGFSEKDVLVDIEVRLISRGGRTFYSGAENEARGCHMPSGQSPQRTVIWDIRENWGSLEASPGAKPHKLWSYVYQYHDRCLSSSLPLIIVCKGVY